MLKEAGVPKLLKQLVKSDNLRQFEQRYEEALSQLQKAVKVMDWIPTSYF